MINRYYEDPQVIIYHGDCRDVLPTLDPVETCITDPPYGLAFMGQEWDHEVPDASYWRLVRDTVKPGGMLLAFGGTRLWHWLAVGIEQAGWEIRDTLMWMYGSGFPKSLDISKAIDKAAGAEREVVAENPNHRSRCDNLLSEMLTLTDGRITAPATEAAEKWNGWGTALKPAWEPIILAMNPTDGTFAENALEHGVAGLNVDGARIPITDDISQGCYYVEGKGAKDGVAYTIPGDRPTKDHPDSVRHDARGRWPANVMLDEEAAEMLDGNTQGKRASRPSNTGTGFAASGLFSIENVEPTKHGGSGASRFFYTAKASRADRGPGNDHPTVKPSDLMKWLCTLTKTPDGGTVLDPFMGSGTTLLAAKETGRKAIGIELEERYCEIAAKRCSQGVLDFSGSGE